MPHAIQTPIEGIRPDKYEDVVQKMLRQGRELKRGGDMEPPISRTDIQHQLKEFEGVSASGAVELALRNTFYAILASTSMEHPSFIDMWSLLDVCLILSDDGVCEVGLTFWLVEELLESQVIEHCQRVFDYLELRREAMVAKHMSTKKLIILRACNELLKRLSRAEDTVFCGRVFIYLFESLAFGDRSAVNLRGEFHVDNATIFEQAEAAPDSSTSAMDVDVQAPSVASDQVGVTVSVTEGNGEAKAGSTIKTGQAPDLGQLYPLFWSLQQYFCRPTMLFEAGSLATFKAGLEATITKFKDVQNENDGRSNATASEDTRPSLKRKMEDANNGLNTFNPKYLTSRDLFELEINDLAFRRHIMVQGLILMDFLLSQTPAARRKLENLKNKSVIYNFTLSEDDAQWAERMKVNIASYLQQGPEGKFYYRMVDTVLSRDKNWVFWKAESCPSFARGSILSNQYIEAQESTQKSSASKRLRPTPIGALDLGFLEESPEDGLSKLADPERYRIPATDGYRGGILDDEFEVDMAKSEDDKKAALEAKSSKVWRTMRIAARSKFKEFDKVDDGNKLDVLFKTGDEEPDGGDKEGIDDVGTEKSQTKPEEGSGVEPELDAKPSAETLATES